MRSNNETRERVSATLRRRRSYGAVLALLVGAALTGAACNGTIGDEGESSSTSSSGCLSNEEFLLKEAWPKVFASETGACISCHSPGSDADQAGSAFVMRPPGYPNWAEHNLGVLREVVKAEYDGTPMLIAKPTGLTSHAGGVRIQGGSEAEKVLRSMADRLSKPDVCGGAEVEADTSDLVLLDARATFRKAAITLAGRAPTGDEASMLDSEGDSALPAMLDALMREEGFYERLMEIYNDKFLTDRYLSEGNVLDRDQYPYYSEVDAIDDMDSTATEAEKEAAKEKLDKMQEGVAREPLNLVRYVVENDLPFTEIVTADYAVMNPYAAEALGALQYMEFNDPTDENELQKGKIYPVIDGEYRPLPHAGVLSSPIFLNRYPTSPTNVNRHRAFIVLREFLATDILKVADRPINSDTLSLKNNPTLNDPTCSVCHAVIDPIAGAFQKFDDNDQEEFMPARVWEGDREPGFYGRDMDLAGDSVDQLPWLGARIAEDPRFAFSTVYDVFEAVTGQSPLEYDATTPDHLTSYRTMEADLHRMADDFVAGGYNLKSLIKAVVMSDYFRAANATSALEGGRDIQLRGYGTGRLLTPEQLAEKNKALLGFYWGRYDGRSYLKADYRLLYGGIDSENVVDRITVPNGIIAAVGWRMANEMSCRASGWDFTKPKAERRLFPEVDVDTAPRAYDEDDNDVAQPGAEEAIKKNIVHLHRHLWGMEVAMDSAEVTRAYDLWMAAWEEGREAVRDDANPIDRGLEYDCRGQKDRENPGYDDLPEDQRITRDENFVVRSWMAVLTYMLADYRYLYD